MEVVCLILVTMLTSQPCSYTLWDLMSLHLLSFLHIENIFFITIVYIHCFFSEWCEYTGVSYTCTS